MKIALSVSSQEKAKGAASPYFRALLAVGAKPEEIKLVAARDSVRMEAETFDGILFAGGGDLDPALYDEGRKCANLRVERARDDFELALLSEAMRLRLPILGICRGQQLINVEFGGTLYQDLKDDAATELEHQQSGSRSAATHAVTLTDPESRLAEAFRGSCRVNSLHHQAIKRVGRGLKVTARAEDGLVEAVQWHPEEMTDRPEPGKILELFLAQCREHAAQR